MTQWSTSKPSRSAHRWPTVPPAVVAAAKMAQAGATHRRARTALCCWGPTDSAAWTDSWSYQVGLAVKGSTTLACLDLSHCGMHAENVRQLARALWDNASLAQLVLRGNRVGNEGAWLFGRVLGANAGLQLLDLGDNGIRGTTPAPRRWRRRWWPTWGCGTWRWREMPSGRRAPPRWTRRAAPG